MKNAEHCNECDKATHGLDGEPKWCCYCGAKLTGRASTKGEYTNNTFHGHWPVGAAAVVEADSPAHAAYLLEHKLSGMGLQQAINPADMLPFNGGVCILLDGNY